MSIPTDAELLGRAYDEVQRLRADGDARYVQGWKACAETIAHLIEIKADDLAANAPRLRDKILHPVMAEIDRHAAKIARARTTEVSR